MAIPTPSLDVIEDFLAQKRIAMAGVSRNPKDFSASLFQELCRRGYDVVPVNPNASEVLGKACFAHVQDIQPKVDAVLLMKCIFKGDDSRTLGIRARNLDGILDSLGPAVYENCL